MTPQERMERGRLAQQVLDGECWAHVRAAIIAGWEKASTTAEREALWFKLKALDALRGDFGEIVNDGHVARKGAK